MRNKKLLAFIHIEKTAGTAVHAYISRNLLGYHPIQSHAFSTENDDSEDSYLTADELSKICQFYPLLSGIGGHSLRSNVDYGNERLSVKYFTFLRDPVSRALSHFHYHREVMKIDWTLDDFLADGSYNNLMCRRICGAEDADAAIAELKTRYYSVGLMEHFDESMQFFRTRTNELGYSFKNIKAEKKNVRSSRAKEPTNYSDQDIDQIKSVNQEDMKLYEFVQKSGPVLNGSIAWGEVLRSDEPTQWSVIDYATGIFNRVVSVSYCRRLERVFRNRTDRKLG